MKHICGPSQFSPAWLCQSPKQAPHLSPLLPSVFFQLSNQRDPFTYKPYHADLSLLQTFLVALISSSVSLYSDIGVPLGSGPFHLLTLLTSFPICHLLTSISRIGSLQVLKWGKHVPVVGPLHWLFPPPGMQFSYASPSPPVSLLPCFMCPFFLQHLSLSTLCNLQIYYVYCLHSLLQESQFCWLLEQCLAHSSCQ